MLDGRLPWRLGLAGVVAIAVAAAGPGSAGAGQLDQLLAKGRAALGRGDGIAAEIAYKDALAAGASRDAIAAGMGEALLDQGKPDDAREWLGQARFSPAEAVHGFRMLSRLEIVAGNLPAAGKALDRALAADGRNAEVWVDIAQLRYRGGEQIQSVDAVERALALDPANVRALDFRGLLVRDQFGPRAALPWFEAGLFKSPSDGALLADYAATLGDLGQARLMLAVTRRMIELGVETPRAFFFQAVLAARAGNHPLARAMLNRVGDGMDGMPAALQLDGLLQLEAGNALLAIQSLDRLATLQPQNEQAQLLLARAMYLAGQQSQLVARFGAMAARPGTSPYLTTLVGRALEDLGRREEAGPLLDRAAAVAQGGLVPVPAELSPDAALAGTRADPRSANAAAAQVRALLNSGRGAEAVAAAERLRGLLPGMAAAQTLAGDAHLALGEIQLADDRYRVASRVRCDDALLTRLVLAAAQSGRRDIAADMVAGYLAANPQSREAARLAADYAASQGDWMRARQLLQHLQSTGSGRDVRLLGDLALAQLRTGDGEAARTTAKEAWHLQRSSPVAALALSMTLAGSKAQQPFRLDLMRRASAR